MTFRPLSLRTAYPVCWQTGSIFNLPSAGRQAQTDDDVCFEIAFYSFQLAMPEGIYYFFIAI